MLSISLAACGGGGGGGDAFGDAAKDFFASAKSSLEAEGRPFNNVYSSQPGQVLTNTFFEWNITNIRKETNIDGLTPAAGNIFIVADTKSTNVFEGNESIPVGNFDFYLLYEDDDGEIAEVPALEEFTDGMYPDEVMEAPGGSVEGFLVFEAPEATQAAMLTYYEIWDDAFEGDTYYFEVDLSN
jgi:hypothetical protein